MSDNGVLEAKLETTHVLLAALSEKMDGFMRNIRKVTEDHENRLREQAKVDAAQGKEVGEIRIQLAGIQADLKVMREAQARRQAREMDFWQEVLLKALPYTVIGASFAAMLPLLQAMGVI